MAVKSVARADVRRQVLFIQGGGEGVHDRWDDKLVNRLRRELGPGYELRYPRMPNEAEPRYVAWKQAIEAELGALRPGAVIIGHSVGGSILAHALAERTPAGTLGAICLNRGPLHRRGRVAERRHRSSTGSRRSTATRRPGLPLSRTRRRRRPARARGVVRQGDTRRAGAPPDGTRSSARQRPVRGRDRHSRTGQGE